jgi:uncharacterized protein involved in exopolysaccharide biosynthesis
MLENSSSMNAYLTDDLDDGVDMRVIAARIAEHPVWLLASILLFTGAFSAAAFLLTPIYRASTVLIPAKADKDAGLSGSGLGGIGGVASLVGINLGGGDSLTEEALAVLKSRQFTEKFINERHLMPILFASKWDAQTGTWKVDEKHQPTPAKAYRLFDKIRSIGQDKKTGLITLSIDWSDRIVAADWANDLVQRLNLEMRQREKVRAESAVGYLEKEFESTSTVATREAISRLIEAQVKQRMFAVVTQEFAFRVIDPAMAPDRDDRHSPPKLALLVAGPMVGFLIGILGILGFKALADDGRNRRSSAASHSQ